MRYVNRDRVAPPEFFLLSDQVRRTREDVATLFEYGEKRRSQSRVEKTSGAIEREIYRDLEELYEGRCAFCEGRGQHPYRFRPSTEAEPVKDQSTSHLYYAWLTTSWDNWHLICEECRPKNEAYFPVRGKRINLPPPEALRAFSEPNELSEQEVAKQGRPGSGGYGALSASWSKFAAKKKIPSSERSLLLDPTRDSRVYTHLHIQSDGTLEPLSERGAETIFHFNLNRTDLKYGRADAIAKLERSLSNGDLLDNEDLLDFPFPGILLLRLRFLTLHMMKSLGASLSTRRKHYLKNFYKLYYASSGEKAFSQARDASPEDLKKVQLPSRLERRSDRRPSSKSKRVTSISLQNFKSLENLKLDLPKAVLDESSDEPTTSLLILGENATGKSSLLEGAVLTLVDRKVRSALREKPKSLVLDPKFMDAKFTGGPKQAVVTVTFDDKTERTLTITKQAFDEPSDPMPTPVFAYGAFRQYLDDVREKLRPEHSVITLFKSDTLLPNPSQWLLSLDDDGFSMVARSLRSIFAVEGEVEVIERDADTCYVVTDYVYDGVTRRERTPLQIVSSGFRAILAMACDIMRGLMEVEGFQTLLGARAIVFIDEIEAHLHPRWKIAIMLALREALPQVTFIVTSHDPLCLRGMRSGEVMVLNRVRGESAPESDLPVFIEKLETLPNIEELTIEQLLTADFFQLNSTDAPGLEDEYARIADMLSKRDKEPIDPDRSLTSKQREHYRSFTRQINEALPVGDTEVQRVVQEAVAEYLAKRHAISGKRAQELRDETKQKIRAVLDTV